MDFKNKKGQSGVDRSYIYEHNQQVTIKDRGDYVIKNTQIRELFICNISSQKPQESPPNTKQQIIETQKQVDEINRNINEEIKMLKTFRSFYLDELDCESTQKKPSMLQDSKKHLTWSENLSRNRLSNSSDESPEPTANQARPLDPTDFQNTIIPKSPKLSQKHASMSNNESSNHHRTTNPRLYRQPGQINLQVDPSMLVNQSLNRKQHYPMSDIEIPVMSPNQHRPRIPRLSRQRGIFNLQEGAMTKTGKLYKEEAPVLIEKSLNLEHLSPNSDSESPVLSPNHRQTTHLRLPRQKGFINLQERPITNQHIKVDSPMFNKKFNEKSDSDSPVSSPNRQRTTEWNSRDCPDQEDSIFTNDKSSKLCRETGRHSPNRRKAAHRTTIDSKTSSSIYAEDEKWPGVFNVLQKILNEDEESEMEERKAAGCYHCQHGNANACNYNNIPATMCATAYLGCQYDAYQSQQACCSRRITDLHTEYLCRRLKVKKTVRRKKSKNTSASRLHLPRPRNNSLKKRMSNQLKPTQNQPTATKVSVPKRNAGNQQKPKSLNSGYVQGNKPMTNDSPRRSQAESVENSKAKQNKTTTNISSKNTSNLQRTTKTNENNSSKNASNLQRTTKTNDNNSSKNTSNLQRTTKTNENNSSKNTSNLQKTTTNNDNNSSKNASNLQNTTKTKTNDNNSSKNTSDPQRTTRTKTNENNSSKNTYNLQKTTTNNDNNSSKNASNMQKITTTKTNDNNSSKNTSNLQKATTNNASSKNTSKAQKKTTNDNSSNKNTSNPQKVTTTNTSSKNTSNLQSQPTITKVSKKQKNLQKSPNTPGRSDQQPQVSNVLPKKLKNNNKVQQRTKNNATKPDGRENNKQNNDPDLKSDQLTKIDNDEVNNKNQLLYTAPTVFSAKNDEEEKDIKDNRYNDPTNEGNDNKDNDKNRIVDQSGRMDNDKNRMVQQPLKMDQFGPMALSAQHDNGIENIRNPNLKSMTDHRTNEVTDNVNEEKNLQFTRSRTYTAQKSDEEHDATDIYNNNPESMSGYKTSEFEESNDERKYIHQEHSNMDQSSTGNFDAQHYDGEYENTDTCINIPECRSEYQRNDAHDLCVCCEKGMKPTSQDYSKSDHQPITHICIHTPECMCNCQTSERYEKDNEVKYFMQEHSRKDQSRLRTFSAQHCKDTDICTYIPECSSEYQGNDAHMSPHRPMPLVESSSIQMTQEQIHTKAHSNDMHGIEQLRQQAYTHFPTDQRVSREPKLQMCSTNQYFDQSATFSQENDASPKLDHQRVLQLLQQAYSQDSIHTSRSPYITQPVLTGQSSNQFQESSSDMSFERYLGASNMQNGLRIENECRARKEQRKVQLNPPLAQQLIGRTYDGMKQETTLHQAPNTSTVCQKSLRLVKFENETSPRKQFNTTVCQRRNNDFQRRDKQGMSTRDDYARKETSSEQNTDYDDENTLNETYVTSSTAEFTCPESNFEDDYATCNESHTEREDNNEAPGFSGCPCMYDELLQFSSLYVPKDKAKELPRRK